MAEFRVVYVASDYDATLAFFVDVMGLAVVREFTDGGKGCIVAAADGQIEFFAPDAGWGPPGVSGARLAWEVESARAAHERLLSAGAAVIQPPTTQPWGHVNLAVEGPDGWVITLFEVIDPP